MFVIFRRVYVFATHGIFSGCAKSILKEFPNLEKVNPRYFKCTSNPILYSKLYRLLLPTHCLKKTMLNILAPRLRWWTSPAWCQSTSEEATTTSPSACCPTTTTPASGTCTGSRGSSTNLQCPNLRYNCTLHKVHCDTNHSISSHQKKTLKSQIWLTWKMPIWEESEKDSDLSLYVGTKCNIDIRTK